jgi:hypothetical protein
MSAASLALRRAHGCILDLLQGVSVRDADETLGEIDAAIKAEAAQVEPVAWRWRRKCLTKWAYADWDSLEKDVAADMQTKEYEVNLLHYTPQQPAPSVGQIEPVVQHPDDIAVDRFAQAMKGKMAVARAKGRSGWDDQERCRSDQLARMLIDHIDKGDPVDVANFAMMIHQRDALGIENMHIANNFQGISVLRFAAIEKRTPKAVQVEPVAAAKKDAVFQASIDFVRELTGMEPPPIEIAPPTTFQPFKTFAEKVCAIFATPQQPAAPEGWQLVPIGEQRDQLEAVTVELVADAARYRWIRERGAWETESFLNGLTAIEYDAAIDAAMKAEV